MDLMNPEKPIRITISRKIAFSCGHRYAREDWTEEKNREIYGSLYAPKGFGHNFVLEASIEGVMDKETGMVVNLRDLDSILKETVAPLDHHFLNTDVEFFKEKVPTSENIAAYCFDEIQRRIQWPDVSLKRVRLLEGSEFWVEVEAGTDQS